VEGKEKEEEEMKGEGEGYLHPPYLVTCNDPLSR
jgi:hypothetical protein